VSLAFLLVAMYVPGLRGALSLNKADAVDWATAIGCALGAWVAAQAGSAAIELWMRGRTLRRQAGAGA
jgi:uncharacterized membrane protein YfcA